MNIVGLIVSILIGALISGFIIWIVGKLGLGLEISGFGAAFIAAIIIAVVAGLINWLLSTLGIHIGKGLLGGIISLIVGAIVLIISSSFVPGLKVKGFGGALVAAIAIGVFSWLLNLVLGTAGLF